MKREITITMEADYGTVAIVLPISPDETKKLLELERIPGFTTWEREDWRWELVSTESVWIGISWQEIAISVPIQLDKEQSLDPFQVWSKPELTLDTHLLLVRVVKMLRELMK